MKMFFDVDGVLIDGWHADPARRRPWDLNLEQDLGVDRAAFQKVLFETPVGGYKSLMHVCVKGERDLKDALAEVLPGVGYAGTADDFVRYWFERDSNVNRDVLAVVERLARHDHVALYLVTGQEHHRAAHLWDDLGFSAYFTDILYSAKLGYLKNEPGFYTAVNEAVGVAAGERPVFFDDTPSVVALAREAGWDAVVFNTVDDLLRHGRLGALIDE